MKKLNSDQIKMFETIKLIIKDSQKKSTFATSTGNYYVR